MSWKIKKMLRAWATISKNRATATSEKQVPNVTFDTNVFITRKPAYFPAGLVLSAVVMQEFGRTPKLPDGDKHRIISDVLIAITARRAQATIITDNLKNFQKIGYYCNVMIESAATYLGRCS